MIIKDFKIFEGQHCEVTATGTLLKNIGIDLSEPMLFGIGQGLGYIYWHMKNMDFPFIGGRIQPDLLTQNIINNLGLKVEYRETSSKNIAWNNVKTNIDNGVLVGLKLDSYHLDYFSSKIHFAGHYVAMYGYDESYAYLVDTAQQGGTVKTSLESLALARSEKGPMSSKNLSYTIFKDKESFDFKKVVTKAIKDNAADFLNPPIKNISYKGIEKTSKEVMKWFSLSNNIEQDFALTALLMERGGTGGALFRNIYRDFLQEAMSILNNENIENAYKIYKDVAARWTEVSDLIEKAGQSKDIKFLTAASGILEYISKQEKAAMQLLLEI